MPGQRFTFLCFLCLGLATTVLQADLVPGSPAIVSSASPLSVNGQPTGSLEAGQSVTVLGLKAATKEAVVSFVDATGKKIVGIVPQSALVAVDSAAPASVQQPAAVPSMPPALPPLDVSKILPAQQIAEYFKVNRAPAKVYEGQHLKLSGTIDRVEVESNSGSTGYIPVLTLATKPGLPKIKVKLSSSLASGDAFFRKYTSSLPGWWWGYHNRQIDFRLANPTTIEARAVYNYNSTTSWSDGTSSVSRGKSKSGWFTVFAIGDVVSVEAYCKGLYMDVEFDGGLIVENDK